VRISRSGFVKRIHRLSSGIFSWFGADSRSSFEYIATEFYVSTMFPPPDTSAWATPSLQWVPWPPLAGALRFPTFLGTMGFYHCSRFIRNPSRRPLESRTAPHEEEIGSSLRFLGHPCGACPGLGTPASRPDLANSGRCRMLPSATLNTSASQR
jgi:hypothetical protein